MRHKPLLQLSFLCRCSPHPQRRCGIRRSDLLDATTEVCSRGLRDTQHIQGDASKPDTETVVNNETVGGDRDVLQIKELEPIRKLNLTSDMGRRRYHQTFVGRMNGSERTDTKRSRSAWLNTRRAKMNVTRVSPQAASPRCQTHPDTRAGRRSGDGMWSASASQSTSHSGRNRCVMRSASFTVTIPASGQKWT